MYVQCISGRFENYCSMHDNESTYLLITIMSLTY